MKHVALIKIAIQAKKNGPPHGICAIRCETDLDLGLFSTILHGLVSRFRIETTAPTGKAAVASIPEDPRGEAAHEARDEGTIGDPNDSAKASNPVVVRGVGEIATQLIELLGEEKGIRRELVPPATSNFDVQHTFTFTQKGNGTLKLRIQARGARTPSFRGQFSKFDPKKLNFAA